MRKLSRTLQPPGANRLRAALASLLKLNLELAHIEARGEPITPPGRPAFAPSPANFVSEDYVSIGQCPRFHE